MQWLQQVNSLLDGVNHATRSHFTGDAIRPRLGMRVVADMMGSTLRDMDGKVIILSEFMMEWRTEFLQKWIGDEKVVRHAAGMVTQYAILSSGTPN